MKKLLLFSVGMMCLLMTSCKTTSHTCDAYTLRQKLDLKKELNATASLNLNKVHN